MSPRHSATAPDTAPDRDETPVAAGTLRAVPPFDFLQSLAFIDSFAPAQSEQITTATCLSKAFIVNGRAIAVRIAATAADAAPELALSVRSDAVITAELLVATIDRVRFYLSLDDDLRPFYAIARADPAFAPVLARLHGYHQVKLPTPFENAAWAILSQRTRMPTARRVKHALTEALGRSIVVAGTTLRAFPEPAAVAAATVADLARIIGNDRKARYLAAASSAFAEVDEAFLRHGPSDDVETWLRDIPGIGPWSASFVLIRGLGRMEAAPVETELARAAARWYGPLSPDELTEIARRYGPWQGYWAHYLRVAPDLASPAAR
ncbi:MAG: DNA-3-methyladenine glycosylase 2 family protein [Chloroflexota bacterium]|nr:DNA-3-methyladenine glycosylase 2 family protein [Chloroflexota bacterium]